MLVLKILRVILPPFHPWKYKWIDWYYGNKKYSINELNESIHQKAHETF